MAVALSTPLCRDLGIEFPIFSVGFGISAGPELVAAVSNAGGCGALGASGLPAQEVRQRIGRVRELTDRPFGVNIIIAELEEPFASAGDRALVLDEIAAALEEHAPLLVLFWGDPAPFVEEAHRSAVKVVIQVGSVAEAEAADAAGVDAVIAQGVEAGGHVRGRTSIWDLLPAAAEAVDPVPVLASGLRRRSRVRADVGRGILWRRERRQAGWRHRPRSRTGGRGGARSWGQLREHVRPASARSVSRTASRTADKWRSLRRTQSN